MAQAARFLRILGVLPLVLANFSAAEVRFWYALSGLLILNMLAESGFIPTFVRAYSFAMGGAKRDQLRRQTGESLNSEANWETVRIIASTARRILGFLSFGYGAVLLLAGTWIMSPAITALESQNSGWIAWTIFVAFQPLGFLEKRYSSYLNGTGHLATAQRIDTVCSLISAFSMVVCLLLGGGILALTIVMQAHGILLLISLRNAARKVHGGFFAKKVSAGWDQKVWDAIWPSSWRSGLGHLLGLGVLQMALITYANHLEAAAGATLLFAFRLLRIISEIANPPFYSRIPEFGRLRATGSLAKLELVAAKGMSLSLLVFAAGFAAAGIVGPTLIDLISKEVDFPSKGVWIIAAVAFFAERFGALHLQLYSTTNHILWHWASGLTAVVFLLSLVFFLPRFEVLGIPLAMLIGNVVVYAPYCAYHSHQILQTSHWQFEKRATIPGFIAVFLAAAAIYVLS